MTRHGGNSSSTQGNLEEARSKGRRSKRIIAITVALLIILTFIKIYIQQLRVPSPIANNIVIFALENVNIILLMILGLMILRNLVNFYFEVKGDQIWAKFRTKLIVTFVGFSLIPSILLYLVASGLISSSIEKWFNVNVESSLAQSLEVAQSSYRDSEKRALFYAQRIAELIAREDLLDPSKRETLRGAIKEKGREYRLDSIQVFSRDMVELESLKGDGLKEDVLMDSGAETLKEAWRGMAKAEMASIGKGNVVRGIYRIDGGDKTEPRGLVVATYYTPESLVAKMEAITRTFEEYKQLKILRKPISTIHTTSILLIALVIIFSGTWVSFNLAKRITVPIEQLAQGTRRIAEGDLDFKLSVRADDEIGILVDSFNQMTAELKNSKREIDKANEELMRSNIELQRRRNYTETVLDNIATGVISIDSAGSVTTINKAAEKILEINAKNFRDVNYSEAFDSPQLGAISDLINNARQNGESTFKEQLQIMMNRGVITILSTVTPLRDSGGDFLGMVIVFEDLTELIKAQKLAAWREVARAIAHEIKNPLTPIQLSAQRLMRKYISKSDDFDKIFPECINTIAAEVEGLKKMVNEFSRFARMPESNPKPDELHKIIGEVVSLYSSSHRDVKIITNFDPGVKTINVDAEQMKRVLINLLENSIDAMNSKGTISIKTMIDPCQQRVKIELSDTGPGIPWHLRDKLFLPYFSTKQRGTGLGLAIVHRIIDDHNGSVRALADGGKGATFLIELPIS